MTQLQVTHIVRALDNVYLCSNTEDRLALTYSAWNQFMQARGTLSLPFNIKLNKSNVTNMQGDRGVVITDASNIGRK
tara:strand:+ start:712 stop:942 length:231 start_codon:yes stop_codon:yes gene_type:complete